MPLHAEVDQVNAGKQFLNRRILGNGAPFPKSDPFREDRSTAPTSQRSLTNNPEPRAETKEAADLVIDGLVRAGNKGTLSGMRHACTPSAYLAAKRPLMRAVEREWPEQVFPITARDPQGADA